MKEKNKPETHADWVPVIKACLEQEEYGDRGTCSLCRAICWTNESAGFCPDTCIAKRHLDAQGIASGHGCIESVRQHGGESFSDIPAVYRWLNALLDWTKEQAAKDEPCAGCVHLRTGEEIRPGAKFKWYCVHPHTNPPYPSGSFHVNHYDDLQSFIHADCPGKEVELWGLVGTSNEPWGYGRSGDVRIAHKSERHFERWFTSSKEAKKFTKWGMTPVRVTADGKEIEEENIYLKSQKLKGCAKCVHARPNTKGCWGACGGNVNVTIPHSYTRDSKCTAFEIKEEKMSEKTLSLADLYGKVSEPTYNQILFVWPCMDGTVPMGVTKTLTKAEAYALLDEHFSDKTCWYEWLEKLIGPRAAKEWELREVEYAVGYIRETSPILDICKLSSTSMPDKEAAFKMILATKLLNFAKAVMETEKGNGRDDWPAKYGNLHTRGNTTAFDVFTALKAEAEKEANN